MRETLPMAGTPNRAFNTACGRLASRLGISQSSARRKVDIRAAAEGVRDPEAKRELAERMLAEAEAEGVDNGELLTSLLEALASERDFMTED
jgi:hypothetical protein